MGIMASIRERIKTVLFSNAALAVMWGVAFLADAAAVVLGLANGNVAGAVAAMLGAIAAALMIFSIFLKEKADAEEDDEAETAAQASSASEAAAVGSAKSGEAEAGGE